MSILNIDSFIQCKYLDECFNLDIDIINNILNIFNSSDNIKIKKNKKIILKKQNILKNSKMQIIKDKVINKINLILNKLSENNFDNLIIEFINNIKFIDQNDFNEFSKAIYLKILNEFKFIKRYLDFYKIIITIYNKVYNYDNTYLFNIIENKFKFDYLEQNIDNDYLSILDINSEDLRLNNLYLIDELVNNNLLSSDIFNYINDIILNQTKYYSDIYYWFKNKNYTEDQQNKILLIINNNILSTRDKILLENMLNKINENNNYKINDNEINDNKINNNYKINDYKINDNEINDNNNKINDNNNDNKINDNNNDNKINDNKINNNKLIIINNKESNESKNLKKNIFNIELNNIIHEYLYLESVEEVDYFICKSCADTVTKNIFSQEVISIYFNSDIDESNKIIFLLKDLIKRQILFKSNLSRGLLNLYNKWTNIEISNNKVKLKIILSLLKSMGITKGLENLIYKNNIN